MKIRTDFVTNSSSSSFIIVYEIDDCQELQNYLKEEYGNFGKRIANKYLTKGARLDKYQKERLLDYINESDFDEDKTYLLATFMEYSNEGNIENDDAFLARVIPEKFIINQYGDEY